MRGTYSITRQAAAKRFHKALEADRFKQGWDIKQMAAHYRLPYRTLHSWIRDGVCPPRLRLRKLCRLFRWSYEAMFEQEAIEDYIFENAHLSFKTLNQRFLKIQSREPLEAWSYVPLAGALVFNTLSAAGFECVATTDHGFGTQIQFKDTRIRHLGLRVSVIFNIGLMISWIDENNLVRGDAMNLSNSTLDLIKETLHSYIRT